MARCVLDSPLQVLEHPQPDAAAMPLEDDLTVWHANLRAPDGPLAGAAIHALMLFPDTYPTEPPEIRLFQALPHPNVRAHPALPE
jgi:ubiquitin-protein ligase